MDNRIYIIIIKLSFLSISLKAKEFSPSRAYEGNLVYYFTEQEVQDQNLKSNFLITLLQLSMSLTFLHCLNL